MSRILSPAAPAIRLIPMWQWWTLEEMRRIQRSAPNWPFSYITPSASASARSFARRGGAVQSTSEPPQ